MTTVIRQITDVEDNELWGNLLTSDLLMHTEENVLEYYCAQDYLLTEELIVFLNRQINEYNYSKIISKYEDLTQSKFFNSILRCNGLRNEHYRSILKTLNRAYNNGFSIEGVETDKILILIDIRVIPMHKYSLSFLREHHPNTVITYIQKSISTYVKYILDENIFNLDEAKHVLQLAVADKYKLGILKKITGPLTAHKEEYSDAIRSQILRNNLDEADISYFVGSYSKEGNLTKEAIVNIAIDKINTIFDNGYITDKGLTDKLIASDISHDIKLKLFALLLPTLNEKQCKGYLSQLGLKSYLSLFKQKRPKIEINKINKRLLEIFRINGWITKFEEDEKEVGYYRAFGRKVHENKEKDDVVLL